MKTAGIFIYSFIGLVLFFSGKAFSEEIEFKKELLALEKVTSIALQEDNKYEYVVIDFWASWCDPCKESIPFYEKLAKEFPKNKVLFLTVNLDDEKKEATKFLKEFPTEFVSFWDKNKIFMKKLNFDSIPHLVVLDKNWKLLESVKGYSSQTKAKVKSYFKK